MADLTLPVNISQLPVHRQAALRAAAIEARIKELVAAGADETLEELELLFGEVTFKWDKEKALAHFNGFITEQSVSSCRKMLGSMKEAESITIYINSPGGDAIAGVALFNLLSRADMKIETIAIGTAYSAASLLFCGGDTRLVAPAASVGIHRSWSFCMGDGDEMLKRASELERMDASILEVYNTRIDKSSRDDVKEAMWDDTMLSAEEAIEFGIATGAAEMPDKSKKKAAPTKKEKEAAREEEKVAAAHKAIAWRELSAEVVKDLQAQGDIKVRAEAGGPEGGLEPAVGHALSELVDPLLKNAG